MKFRWIGTIGLASVLALTACGGGAATPPTTANPSPAADGNGGAAAETLEVAGTDTLRFDPEALTASAGQETTVNFSNEGALQHNWVLVEPGQEQTVANAGAAANGEVASDTEGVIVAGDVIDGGSNEEISVPALEAGEYTYICTVPGHFAGGMRGTLTVE